MSITRAEVSGLRLYSFDKATPTAPVAHPLMIIGNAYGIMPYQIPLAESMAARGWDPMWFSFRGQPGATGVYTGYSGLEDIDIALKWSRIRSSGSELRVIAHCAGAAMILEYMANMIRDEITALAVYGLLFNPQRRRKIAESRLKKCGVNTAISDEVWNHSPLTAISRVQVPMLFCHPRDRLNLSRATEGEIGQVERASQFSQVMWFERGYDRSIETLPQFVSCYDRWFKTSRTGDHGDVSVCRTRVGN